MVIKRRTQTRTRWVSFSDFSISRHSPTLPGACLGRPNHQPDRKGKLLINGISQRWNIHLCTISCLHQLSGPHLGNVTVTLQNPNRLQDHLFYGAFTSITCLVSDPRVSRGLCLSCVCSLLDFAGVCVYVVHTLKGLKSRQQVYC